jgi:hypothetical protein
MTETAMIDEGAGGRLPAGDRSERLPQLTSTAWLPGGALDVVAWAAHGRRLGAIGRGVAWWIGDWLLYGNARYGEKYARAAKITGYDVQTLMNMVYVASRFAPARRRERLSWSHHAELASLPEPVQERWLMEAETHRMSVRSLRQEVRNVHRQTRRRELNADRSRELGAGGPTEERAADTATICPHCRSIIPPPRGLRESDAHHRPRR